MSKKFNIREWVLSVKYWSLLFIPHISICIIFLIYTLVGASIIQEIESDDSRSTSSATTTVTDITTAIPNIPSKNLERERERLLSKIIDKRQTTDLQQYTKYINKQIREYEEELKKAFKTTTTSPSPTVVLENPSITEENVHWSFSGSLYFIGTTLTTIGSNEFTPVTTIGKLFLMIYIAIGIPLTLVFLSDLSLLITRLIKYLSLLLLRIYSTNYFLHIRQWSFFRFIERHLNISIPIPVDEDDILSPRVNPSGTSSFDYSPHENDSHLTQPTIRKRRLSHHRHIIRLRNIYNILIDTIKDINDDIDLTMPQLLITLLIYILLGACLIVSNSYFDSVYICFTSLFTINLNDFYRNVKTSHDNNIKSLFIFAIYLLFGLAIVALCIKAVQIRIQTLLGDIGTKLLRDLVEFLRQMGFHELSTDDILATNDLGSYSLTTSITSENLVNSRQQRFGRTLSTTSDLSALSPSRPIGIAEPVRRLSGSLIVRAFKNADSDTGTDKSVQVNTIIRSCGRCAGSTPSPAASMLSVRKHNTMSATSSSAGETSSGCEDDDVSSSSLQPPNLDRLRQRRATLVAKTIINQMATQPPSLSTDESVPPLTLVNAQRGRTSEQPSSVAYKYAAKKASSPTPPPPPDTPRKRGVSQEEFLEISKQISSLLTPSDDEN